MDTIKKEQAYHLLGGGFDSVSCERTYQNINSLTVDGDVDVGTVLAHSAETGPVSVTTVR